MDSILNFKKCDEDDLYKLIGCDESSTVDQILAEYKVLSLRYHPDKNCEDLDCVQKFQKIQKAKEILTNPETRALYDKWHRCGFTIPFSQFQNLTKEAHTSMHWVTKKQKDLMLESCCPSNYDCNNECSDQCESNVAAGITWKRDPAGRTLQKFRNYEI